MSNFLTPDKYLNNEEVEALKTVLAKYPCRDSVMLELKLYSGCRASELLALEFKDLNGDVLFIKSIKKSNDREVVLPSELVKKIHTFCKRAVANSEKQNLFPISYQRLDQIWREWRPFKKKLHSLRHTFAVRLFEKSRDLRLVQYCLGHKGLQTTSIYLTHVYSTNEQRKYL